MYFRTRQLVILILVLLAIQVGLSFLVLNKTNYQPVRSAVSGRLDENYAIQRAYFMSADFYDEAYNQADKNFVYDDKVKVGILPHHLMVKGKIATFFAGLKNQDIKTVVLVSPNHFEQGGSNITLSSAKWQTPFGDLLPDTKLIKNLIKQERVVVNEQPFGNEHGISGLVAFIKKSLPESKIVPIILKNKTSQVEITALVANIKKYSSDDTLVLASVDFSHYQPAGVADFHDDKSRSVIEALDTNRVWGLEVDSPASLAVALQYAADNDAQKANLLWQTNSSRLINSLDTPGTSHQFFYFTKGEPKKTKVIDFLFFGDIMLDRNVGAKIAKSGVAPLFDQLAGEEKRFFMGPDIISANLEGAVTNGGEHYAPVASNDFAFSPEIVGELKKYNFNFFNIAQNHLTDQGAKGVKETLENLQALGFDFSGCSDAEVGECSSKIVDIDGSKIAMIGLSMVYHHFDLELAKKIISDLKKQSDLVVVNIHWGVEYDHEYNTTQQTIAHAIVDSGADIIIGHHPHVVQGLEIYNNKPIFYSLGNFIFDQYFSADTQTGLALGVSVDLKNRSENIYLLPIESQASQVRLMTEQNKINFFKKMVSWSKAADKYQNMILSGKISL
ncbi:MAG: AmmeMemoRadiSam system protein B [Patescibacteria group bacterium]